MNDRRLNFDFLSDNDPSQGCCLLVELSAAAVIRFVGVWPRILIGYAGARAIAVRRRLLAAAALPRRIGVGAGVVVGIAAATACTASAVAWRISVRARVIIGDAVLSAATTATAATVARWISWIVVIVAGVRTAVVVTTA